jgi:hypothetical protein
MGLFSWLRKRREKEAIAANIEGAESLFKNKLLSQLLSAQEVYTNASSQEEQDAALRRMSEVKEALKKISGAEEEGIAEKSDEEKRQEDEGIWFNGKFIPSKGGNTELDGKIEEAVEEWKKTGKKDKLLALTGKNAEEEDKICDAIDYCRTLEEKEHQKLALKTPNKKPSKLPSPMAYGIYS